MKRVGLDATPLIGPRSGIGNYTGRLLEAMLALAPEREFYLFSKKELNGLESSLQRAQRVSGYLPASSLAWSQLVLPRLIRSSQPDLMHFTNSLAPLVPSAPSVITIHDASLFVQRHFHPLARQVQRLLLPTIARRATAVITVSNHARGELSARLGLPEERLHVIYEAAPDHFRPVDDVALLEDVRQRHQLPECFILYVGTLEPRKNLPRLLEAFRLARRRGLSHRLVFVGPNGWMMQQLQRTIEALALGEGVHFCGYVPEADLPAIYSLADLFVYPSLYEGFGLPPLEAMACGTPVLTSNRASLAELYSDAAYLVDPESVACIAEALVTLIEDESLRADMRRRGLEQARKFSWRQTATATMALYDRVHLHGVNGKV